MTLPQIRPNSRTVQTDVAGRPIRVLVADREVAVEAIETIREEVAAYPAATGPRTLFTVRAGGVRLRLVHEHRADRWTVDRVAGGPFALATAA